MCGGADRVAALLARLHNNSVDVSQLASLPSYSLLKSTRHNDNTLTSRDQTNKHQTNNNNKQESLKDKKELNLSHGINLIPQRRLTWFILITGVLLGICYNYQLHTQHGFTKLWLWWENVDLYGEQCTIEMPATVQDVFRPPVDCSMCKNVREVERVHDVSSELFEERYAYTGRPVVITDGQKNWSAASVLSFDFFRSIYSEDSPVLENFERDCQFFPYQTEFRNVRDAFNMTEERQQKPWYIGWSNCDSSAANILRQHYQRPYFFPKAAEASKTDWIFIGTPGYGAHLHIDHVGNPSWQAQIKGEKLWTLEPPPECHFSCQGMEVVVHPGEIIVLDTNIWYHKTKIVSKDISITIGSEYD